VKVHFDRFDYRSCLIRLPIYENVRSERYESAPFDIYKRYLIASQQLTAKPPFRPIPDGQPGIRAENSQSPKKKKTHRTRSHSVMIYHRSPHLVTTP
jgi:hypothetical protein